MNDKLEITHYPKNWWYPKTAAILFDTGKDHILGRYIKVTKANMHKLAVWCSAEYADSKFNAKDGSRSNHRIGGIKTPKGKRTAYVGDYIVRIKVRKNDIPVFYVIKEEVFYRDYLN